MGTATATAGPAAAAPFERVELRAMAARVEIVLVRPHRGAAQWARHRIGQLEDRWSRFLPHSELSALNRAGGRPVRVHADTIVLVSSMLAAHEATGGRYDPSMLTEIVELGYRRSIEDPAVQTADFDDSGTDTSFAEGVEVIGADTVRLAPGLCLDPGGIGKGLAADLVARELVRSGTGGALVGIGGDLAMAGSPPEGVMWTVAVDDPFHDGLSCSTLEVSEGGVATSSTRSRRWQVDGSERHHQIDPATRAMSATDAATVTVAAGAGWLAEAHATAAVLEGSAGAVGYLRRRGLAGVVVDGEGVTHNVQSYPHAERRGDRR